jgi:ABC-type multidrug transport system permease subunit
MSAITSLTKKNFLSLMHDKPRIVAMFMFPLLMMVLFGYSNNGVSTPHFSTAVGGNSNQTLAFTQMLQKSGYFDVQYKVGSYSDIKSLLDSGKITDGFLLQPDNKILFYVDESDVFAAQQAGQAAQALIAAENAILVKEQQQAMAQHVQEAFFDLTTAQKMISYQPQNSTQSFTTASVKTISFQSTPATAIQQAAIQSNNLATMLTGVDPSFSKYAFENSQFLYGLYYSSYPVSVKVPFVNTTTTTVVTSVLNSQPAVLQLQKAEQELQMQNSTLITLVQEPVYGSNLSYIDFLIPGILAFISIMGVTMNLGRAIAGEKEQGVLKRVFLTPISNTDIILGNGVGFWLIGIAQTLIILFIAITLFNFTLQGDIILLLFTIALNSMVAVGMGLLISSQAKNSDQFQQIAMLTTFPMMFVSGVFFPLQAMPSWLQFIAQFIPLTYGVQIFRLIMVKSFTLAQVLPMLGIMAGFAIVFISLGVIMFKREI